MNKVLLIGIYIIAILFGACSNTKRLPEGEMLYVGAKVIINDTAISHKKRKELK